MAEMSDGFANCRCGQPLVKPPVNPSGGQGFEEGVCWADRRLQHSAIPRRADMLNFSIMVGTPFLTGCVGFLDSSASISVCGQLGKPDDPEDVSRNARRKPDLPSRDGAPIASDCL